MKQAPGDARRDVRATVIEVALKLLRDGGQDAVTTRAVTDAAGIQAPTLYRLFGDKRGLLDAVVEHGYELAYNEKLKRSHHPDPVESMREGWAFLTRFGLENSMLFSLTYSSLRPGFVSPVIQKTYHLLEKISHQLAVAGRLKVTEKQATDLVYATSCGVVLALISMPEEQRDLRLSKDACEAVINAITTDAAPERNTTAAITLHASLSDVKCLTSGERLLLSELLQRIALDE
ncbi:TetR/AcrR family transcriptional regulator [Amycolatopsis pigmentata]|uniref:TetR/AcrR family transcriptional regulator n=1 Tax=Amycolatopsis pigmentata TaxID=450801 RepID=A0ABW5G0C7_9PSEU